MEDDHGDEYPHHHTLPRRDHSPDWQHDTGHDPYADPYYGYGRDSYGNPPYRRQPPPQPPPVPLPPQTESKTDKPTKSSFHFSSPESIFSKFLRSGGTGTGDEDVFSDFGGGSSDFGTRPNEDTSRGRERSRSPEITVVERPLSLTLEDLFNGTSRKMKIKRKVFDPATGETKTEDRILEVLIKKGLKAGSKIKFSDVGDQTEGSRQDLHFILSEKVHPLFRRYGHDLHYSVTLSLKEALCGFKRNIMTIDGKSVPLSRPGPIQPDFKEHFPGLGMPVSQKPDERGDLVVGFKIKHPQSLTARQKKVLNRVFTNIESGKPM
ncbi:uncharacterized protein BDZ99DRAFT_384776 [Mytilinidion resinicola]|uniref:Chaperone DnaJ C-terminal domain-containing protein n=1 Tax=Mytilinidion resinicola TaxID=574789 RepID=A0A6A6YSP5_9PEZI|nr:uncharacterized protein BDZ99DRAFT_384776 [Mytilinidion resinicola]KAF2811578.1 hypothetical protein BDZ99DRAFT_384776 [Mytilinidion resinicola]